MTPRQINNLRLGDVVRCNGRERKVLYLADKTYRGVTTKNAYIGFKILRCSWTTRPTTLYLRSDLLHPRWTVTRAKGLGLSRLERACRHELKVNPHVDDLELHCCDVT